jgi:2',3'-cyclic-nucleotide 2'-phosphodiesterase / 3'-nucleotidase / 5'-nucleotidase
MESWTRSLASLMATMVLVSACARQNPTPPAAPVPVRVDTASPPQLRPVHELVFLGTTDVHTRIQPYDYYTRQEVGYGLVRLKPLIDSVRAANQGRTYLFDSGDLLQGNPLGYVFARIHTDKLNPIIRAMNMAGYSASTVGNHEYNFGLANLNRAMSEAQFPFVTANVFKHGTQEHAYRPYVLLPHIAADGDTILIGVTGNTPPGVEVWDKSNVQGVLDFRDIVESLRPVVREMKTKGADVVVLLSHGGLSGTSYDTIATGLPPENASARVAREVAGIDVIFLGHTHRELQDSTINGVLLTQAKNWAQSLAAVSLKLERRAANDWIVIDKHARILKPDPARADTAFMDSMRWEHERTIAYVKSVAGTLSERIEAREARVKDTPILDFIAEVQRKVAGTDLSAVSAFDINAALPKGNVTISDIAGLYVYENTLKAVRITGAQLRAYLEKAAEYYNQWPATRATSQRIPGYDFDVVSGVDYTLDVSKPIGQRVTRLLYQGQTVRDDQTFTMAVNNYRQNGGGGYSMVANAPVVYDRQQGVRELLIEEFQRRKTIRPADYFRQNWTIEPAAATAAALADQRQELRKPLVPAKRLRVVTTNDVHGRLLPETPPGAQGRQIGGLAALAAYFRTEEEGFEGPTIILDGGDVMQGTPVSNLTKGHSTIAAFNEAGYDGAALGNHDFDWSVPVLRQRVAQAKFPWLSANVFIAGTNRQPAWAKPTAMLTLNGVKVGIIGLSTEATPATTKSSNVVGLEFRSGSDAINRWVPELRKQGADFVIVVAHSGAACDAAFTKCQGEALDWASAVTNKPDLFVGGHTHRIVRYVQNGIPVVESGSYTTRYGVVDLAKDSAGVRVWVHEFPVPWATVKIASVDSIVQKAVRQIGPQVNRTIATFADTIRRGAGEGALGNLLADAFRVSAGAQLSFVNNGSIRIPEIPAGPVTWGTLYSLQPFENRVVNLTMSGALIRDVTEYAVRGQGSGMHISGMTVIYNPGKPVGQRVESMQLLSGEYIKDDGTYTVAVTDFLATGTGDGYTAFGKASKNVDANLTDLEAVIKYLQGLPQPIKRDRAERRFRVPLTP